MRAKIEFIFGLLTAVIMIIENWNTFSLVGWSVGLIAVVFFWGIWIKENNKKEA